MNAPTEVPIHQTITLDRLIPSSTNPRKRFDETKLKELAESIKVQGILQPLLVRAVTAAPLSPKVVWPFPEPLDKPKTGFAGKFEIIAGERRYRAAKLAGLPEVPCLVRNLTDLQVLHAQVIENLQRDDLHPLEEAEGYEKLMKDHGVKAEELGGQVGKSKGYVYARLKLLALCEDARQAFYDGRLDASTALLIARIPVEKVQLQALHKITAKDWRGESMSYRQALDHVQHNYMLDLKKAPFDTQDAALYPKAGACTDCPKRTGNQPGLFDDVKSKDVCTDPVCHAMKKTAHVLAVQKQAQAEGAEVIKAKDAKKILHQWHDTRDDLHRAGLATLDAPIPNDPKGRTWENALKHHKLLGAPKDETKPAVQKTIIEDPYHDGEIIQAVSIEQATKALRQAGFEISLKRQSSSGPGACAADKKRLEKEKAQVDAENAWRSALFDKLCLSIATDLSARKMRPELFRVLAENAVDDETYENDTIKRLIAHHAPDLAEISTHDKRADAFQKRLPDLTPAQHFSIVFELQMIHELDLDIWAVKRGVEAATLLRIAQIQGVDAEAIKEEAMAEHQAKVAEEAKAAAEAKTKAKKPAAKK
jgi:ParB/RepB/Spo0J family partition protein